jgi:hypothetical protein
VHNWAWPGEQDAWQVALPPANKFAVAVLGERQQTCDFAQLAALEHDRAAPPWHCPMGAHADSAGAPGRKTIAQHTCVAAGHAVVPHATVPTIAAAAGATDTPLLDDPICDRAPPDDPPSSELLPDDELLTPPPDDEPADDPPVAPVLEALPPHDAVAIVRSPRNSRIIVSACEQRVVTEGLWPRLAPSVEARRGLRQPSRSRVLASTRPPKTSRRRRKPTHHCEHLRA